MAKRPIAVSFNSPPPNSLSDKAVKILGRGKGTDRYTTRGEGICRGEENSRKTNV